MPNPQINKSNFTIPTNIREAHILDVSVFCELIIANRERLPSFPTWSLPDADFILCQESLQYIESLAATYCDYLQFPFIDDFDYSKRPANTFSLDEVINNFKCGNAALVCNLQEALTISYEKYESYVKLDLFLKNVIHEYVQRNEENKIKSEKRKKPKIKPYISEYELAQARYRSAIRKKDKAIERLDKGILIAKLAMELELQKHELGV